MTDPDIAALVTVRPLEWRQRLDLPYLHEAKGSDGWFRNIRESCGRFILEADHLGTEDRIFQTLEAAKAAAQADYTARILAAIEPGPEVLALVEENNRLRKEVARVTSDRAFVIGANHGYDECLAQMTITCIRYGFDGYGWHYIDSGSGSDWMARGMRHPDAEPMFCAPPNYEEAQFSLAALAPKPEAGT